MLDKLSTYSAWYPEDFTLDDTVCRYFAIEVLSSALYVFPTYADESQVVFGISSVPSAK